MTARYLVWAQLKDDVLAYFRNLSQGAHVSWREIARSVGLPHRAFECWLREDKQPGPTELGLLRLLLQQSDRIKELQNMLVTIRQDTAPATNHVDINGTIYDVATIRHMERTIEYQARRMTEMSAEAKEVA